LVDAVRRDGPQQNADLFFGEPHSMPTCSSLTV
jgi:hypothetical protein